MRNTGRQRAWRLGGLGLLASLLVAGCATPPLLLPPAVGPVGPHLALAPVAMTYVPSADRPAKSPFYPPFQPRIDSEGLNEALVRLLEERGAFASVTPLSGEPDTWDGQAKLAGATQRLELEVDAVELRFVGTNGWHVPKVAIFIASALLIFPGVDPFNWIIPGEDFAIVAAGRWTLHPLGDSSPPQRGRWERELTRDSFAAFGLGSIPSRPWFVVGFLRVPGCLDEEDWGDIAKGLKAPAELGLLQALVLESEDCRNKKGGTSGG